MTAKRKSMDSFVFKDINSSPTVELPLDAIVLSPYQPRAYFDSEQIESLVQSINKYGILSRLIVRPLANSEQYELVAGGRRFEAATKAGLAEVPVVIKELSDEEAMEIALIENLQREDLNPLEETEGVLNLLSVKLKIAPQDLPSLLHRLQELSRGRKKIPNNVVGENERLETVRKTFEELGSMNLDSFISHRLPLLNLPRLILDALRKGQIAYTKALAISKVQDSFQMTSLLEEAFKLKLSLSQIRLRVTELNQVTDETSEKTVMSLRERIDNSYRRLKKSKILDDPKKQKEIEKLMAKIETLLLD